jgi:hypothetical protein
VEIVGMGRVNRLALLAVDVVLKFDDEFCHRNLLLGY